MSDMNGRHDTIGMIGVVEIIDIGDMTYTDDLCDILDMNIGSDLGATGDICDWTDIGLFVCCFTS